MNKCVCKHKKTDHHRYQYSGKDISMWDKKDVNKAGNRVTIYGQCNRCYDAYQKLSYNEKVKAVARQEKAGNVFHFGIPVGCNKYEQSERVVV